MFGREDEQGDWISSQEVYVLQQRALRAEARVVELEAQVLGKTTAPQARAPQTGVLPSEVPTIVSARDRIMITHLEGAARYYFLDGGSPSDVISSIFGYAIGLAMRELDWSPEAIGRNAQALAEQILVAHKQRNP